jgi:LysM repeat protein
VTEEAAAAAEKATATATEKSAPTPALDADGMHTVQKGESLFGISRMHGVSVQDLQSLNNISGTAITVGQRIRVRAAAPARPVPAPAKTDAASVKADAAKSDPATVKKDAAPTVQMKDGRRVHVVQAGETLYSIARQYGATVDDIGKWNKLSSHIRAGQELFVDPPSAK